MGFGSSGFGHEEEQVLKHGYTGCIFPQIAPLPTVSKGVSNVPSDVEVHLVREPGDGCVFTLPKPPTKSTQ